MALSANTIWEVRTAGADTNGGGFVEGASGSPYSEADTARSGTGTDDSTTDAVANGTTTITSATANFSTAIVGNILYFQGGTGAIAAQWRQVTSRTNATTIVIDAAIAASTGMTMNIGGALLSPAIAAASMVAGNKCWIKSGTYTITSASTNIAGGCVSVTATNIFFEGYGTSRGDLGTKPIIKADGVITTFTLFSSTGARSLVVNLEVDGNSRTSSRGMVTRGVVRLCTAKNCTNNGFLRSTNCLYLSCAATGCSSGAAFSAGVFVGCIAYDNTNVGFALGGSQDAAIYCIADSNSGASSDGFQLSAPALVVGCVAYNNAKDGFDISLGTQVLVNCLAEANVNGFDLNSLETITLLNCGHYTNTTNVANATGKGVSQVNMVSGSASFFVDAPNQNFALNTTAGGGAEARAAGWPGALPVGGTGYVDLGTLQHQDSGSGGGLRLAGRGGLAVGS